MNALAELEVSFIKWKRFVYLLLKRVPFCGEKSYLPERSTLRSKDNSYSIAHENVAFQKSSVQTFYGQFWTTLWILRRKINCTSSGHGLNGNNTKVHKRLNWTWKDNSGNIIEGGILLVSKFIRSRQVNLVLSFVLSWLTLLGLGFCPNPSKYLENDSTDLHQTL